jgi:hypothetical protein
MSFSYDDWCMFCIYIIIPNVHRFGMFEATELGIRRLGHFQWHDFPDEFHNNP